MQSYLGLIGLWLCLPTLSFKIVVLIGLYVNCSFQLQVREDIQAADQEATQAVDQEVIQVGDREDIQVADQEDTLEFSQVVDFLMDQ